jgi:hypothetical protein
LNISLKIIYLENKMESLYMKKEKGKIACYRESELLHLKDYSGLEKVINEKDVEECLAGFGLLEKIKGCDNINRLVNVEKFDFSYDLDEKTRMINVADKIVEAPVSLDLDEDETFYPIFAHNDEIAIDFEPKSKMKTLGFGRYGVIIPYRSKKGTEVALKIIFEQDKEMVATREEEIVDFINDKEIKCDLIQGKHITGLAGKNLKYIVYPSLNGSLDSLLPEIRKTKDNMKFKIALSILNPLVCLAQNGLYYTDMKPSNVLFRCVGDGKITTVIGDVGSLQTTEDNTIIATFSGPNIDEDKMTVENLERTTVWAMLWTMSYFWDESHHLKKKYKKKRQQYIKTLDIDVNNSMLIDMVHEWVTNKNFTLKNLRDNISEYIGENLKDDQEKKEPDV